MTRSQMQRCLHWPAAPLLATLLCALLVLGWFMLSAAERSALDRAEVLRAVYASSLQRLGDGVRTALSGVLESQGWVSSSIALQRTAEGLQADQHDLGTVLRDAIATGNRAGSTQAADKQPGNQQANYRWVAAELRNTFAPLISDPGVDDILVVRRSDALVLYDSRSGAASRLGQTMTLAAQSLASAQAQASPGESQSQPVQSRMLSLVADGAPRLVLAASRSSEAPLIVLVQLSTQRIVSLLGPTLTGRREGLGAADVSVSLIDEQARVHVGRPGGVSGATSVMGRSVHDVLFDGPLQGGHGKRVFVAQPIRMNGLAMVLAVDVDLSVFRAHAWASIVWAALVLSLATLLIYLLFRRVHARLPGSSDAASPTLARILSVVDAMGDGRFDLRSAEPVEPGAAGSPTGVPARIADALDRALDGPIDELQRAQRDTDTLNDSVIEIMRAVGTIATTKDLTIRVPVTEDVTGAVSDALNLLTDETARAFRQVSRVSKDVALASIAVRGQANRAGAAARAEYREVEAAARELDAAAGALTGVAGLARRVNDGAQLAVRANESALERVEQTDAGVTAARRLIGDTEKQIKRLGERTQEIGQVLALIRSMSERTGILALNASMHASAVGERSQGFASVAQEVGRLSSGARDATEQIAHLVTAIQSDTAETMKAMGAAIEQVVTITGLSRLAQNEMKASRARTVGLAQDVQSIAQITARQARASTVLKARADRVKSSSAQMSVTLEEQLAQTHRLAECARALLAEVSIFKVDP